MYPIKRAGFLTVALGFAFMAVAHADVTSTPKSISKASNPDARGNGKPEVKYDFAKDATQVDSEVIHFDSKVNYSGDEDLVFTMLRFRYSYEGKAQKRPAFVTVEIHDYSNDQMRSLENLYLRFGNKKITVPLRDKSKKGTLTLLNAEGRIPVAAFVEMSKASEFYFKVDDDARLFVVKSPYTQVVKAIAARFPQPKASGKRKRR